jgi:sialic acid synthase SpsE
MILKEIDKPYIIAEIGANHNGDVALAKEMIRTAKECGANAVKFQHFSISNLCTQDNLDELDSGVVKLENVDQFNTPELGLNNVREQIIAFSFSEQEMSDVRKYARSIDIDFGCTTEDAEGVKFLQELDVDFIKLSSADATNVSLIRAAVLSNYPILLSTGMADLAEIDNAYRIFNEFESPNFALLHCVSIYPPTEDIVNLNFIDTLNKLYNCPIGYSDHTLDYSISLAAVAKGVNILEKHFTLDKNMAGWDHKVSADPSDLKIICEESRRIHSALGSKYKIISKEELHKRDSFRKSITTNTPFLKGEKISYDRIAFKRPGTGISPDLLKYVIGRRVNKNISDDKTLNWSDLA